MHLATFCYGRGDGHDHHHSLTNSNARQILAGKEKSLFTHRHGLGSYVVASLLYRDHRRDVSYPPPEIVTYVFVRLLAAP